MRFLKNGVLVCVCLLIGLTGYLAMRSIQLEGASLKTCALLSAPLLIWLAYQKVSLFAEKYATERKIIMKNKIIILSAAAALLMSGGLAFAGFDSTPQPQYVGPPFGSTPQPEYLSQKGEQVTTNVLLRQILAEVMKGNAQKADNRCSDGEKNYSPGYIIGVDKKTLRCDTGNGYPEWVEDKA